MKKRIGIFGGTFNPFHIGHLAVAQAAMAQLGLDRLLVVPSGHPPLKGAAGLLDGERRFAMIAAALADEPRMEACDIEILRPGPSYTVDTVRELRRDLGARNEFHFLLGSDCLDQLPHWRGIDELHATLRFAVIQRAGARRTVTDPRIVEVALPPVGVSATEIRSKLARGEAIDGLVPAAIANYIAAQRLYVAPAGADA